jgi:hypothetical protein
MEVRMARRALSYLRRNHLAVFALVFAMAGTSVAASHLGRNTVGARQIKTGGVTSAEIKNHSLKRPDFKRGLLPTAGAGAGATTYWAKVSLRNATTTVEKSSDPGISAENAGGTYTAVSFPKDVSGCAVLMTVDGDQEVPIRKVASLSSDDTVVAHVATTTPLTDFGFSIAVFC